LTLSDKRLKFFTIVFSTVSTFQYFIADCVVGGLLNLFFLWLFWKEYRPVADKSLGSKVLEFLRFPFGRGLCPPPPSKGRQ
jgi:hypothetical protein